MKTATCKDWQRKAEQWICILFWIYKNVKNKKSGRNKNVPHPCVSTNIKGT